MHIQTKTERPNSFIVLILMLLLIKTGKTNLTEWLRRSLRSVPWNGETKLAVGSAANDRICCSFTSYWSERVLDFSAFYCSSAKNRRWDRRILDPSRRWFSVKSIYFVSRLTVILEKMSFVHDCIDIGQISSAFRYLNPAHLNPNSMDRLEVRRRLLQA